MADRKKVAVAFAGEPVKKNVAARNKMGKYSSVSSVIERIKRKMAEGRKLRARIERPKFQL